MFRYLERGLSDRALKSDKIKKNEWLDRSLDINNVKEMLIPFEKKSQRFIGRCRDGAKDKVTYHFFTVPPDSSS